MLRHLEDFKTLTSWEAFESYGITRLSAVIFTLREDGYDIYSDKVSTKNRYGNTVNFSKYYLKD